MDSLLSLVLGHAEIAARRSVEMAQVEQRSGMTDEQWWHAPAPLLGRLLDPQRYPTAARVGAAAGQAHGAAHDPEHTFQFGLERILDGAQAFVVSRR